ncbi:kynureninase [Nitrococcus mobilis]|uniref:Kynureninase n=1 Tax=Nitrococcus mobilis Nb-231 TaxID=314278 RepID=A4BV35_9GAMM|nr:kynureninase [Nitrococcus mobilis]EAR20456.1 Kynureninase [Nitrococcus mobilis Nb-231]
MYGLSRDDCERLDREDPLGTLRGRFELPSGLIYLDGNSLGALPVGARQRLDELVRVQWGEDLIRSWNRHDWIGMPRRIGAKIARLIGARDDEVIAADSTSINLFKLLAAALRLRPRRRIIVSERTNFPTDLYIIEGLIELLGQGHELRLVHADELSDALDEKVAVLVMTQVDYRSGRLHDLAALTRQAQAKGVLTLWDLSHSAGAMPIELNAAGVDMAVGCGYKYLNGGPGAPAYLFIARRHLRDAQPTIAGWMGHAAPFTFAPDYRPAAGIERHLVGTPPVLGLAALEVGVDLLLEADLQLVREKSRRLGDLYLRLLDQECAAFGFEHACPHDSTRRGSQVAVRHPQGYAIIQALIVEGVIGDFRAPDILRFGLAPLYLRYVDIWDAVAALHRVMASQAWNKPEFKRKATVT